MCSREGTPILGFTRYQWLVLAACWLGWGFDVFDALLFNYVARLCIPSLLGPENSSPQILTAWTGTITSVLLVGWAIGGIFFGKVTDRIGRSRALLITMLTYALATAACAGAQNIWQLLVFRFIASLGIGGEWAAGASLVAETVPENKRVQGGALLYTAAPMGLFLATFITDLLTRKVQFLASDPDLAWRLVFLTGLIPAGLAILIRLKVREPEKWLSGREKSRLRDLFSPQLIRQTVGGLLMATIALLTWWSCNAFIPVLASFLVNDLTPPPDPMRIEILKAQFTTISTTCLNLGGLIGTLATVPVALYLGRRPMFLLYFGLSTISVWLVFHLPLSPYTRMYSLFFVGLSVFGIFGSFTFYLPELFPTHLRGTGSGFCYNTGRLITALGPFIVGSVASHSQTSTDILNVVAWVAAVPFIGVLLVLGGFGQETRHTVLE